jgi:hypothetical protein
MSHPYHHALSSVKKYGGVADDYLHIHEWFDESKKYIADVRHRALRHHTLGIFECQQQFGVTLTNSDGKVIPVRFIGEQHVFEDLNCIPTLQDWLCEMPKKSWMNRTHKLSEGVKHETDIRTNNNVEGSCR